MCSYEKTRCFPEEFGCDTPLYGKQLFEFEKDSNLRIMSNNVWFNDVNNEIWANMGEDCSVGTRSKGLVACYLAFMPDVIHVQELGEKMRNEFASIFHASGHPYEATEIIHSLNILYHTETVSLLDHGYHIFTYGDNGKSKGYTWALFEHKATGKQFISVSTHFWWKSEAMQAGSDAWRADQANETAEQCKKLAEQFQCPVFLAGDFNARLSSQALQNIQIQGLSNCFDIALESDNLDSHHFCGPNGFGVGDPGTNEQAIDHMFCYHLGEAVVNAFRRTQPAFFAKLSDHWPLYIDVTLK